METLGCNRCKEDDVVNCECADTEYKLSILVQHDSMKDLAQDAITRRKIKRATGILIPPADPENPFVKYRRNR